MNVTLLLLAGVGVALAANYLLFMALMRYLNGQLQR